MAWNRNGAKAKAAREAREARIRELIDGIDGQMAELRHGAKWERLMKYFATFHKYSLKNIALIMAQKPDATHIAGYRAWQARGRQVRKGERGLLICAPRGKYPKEDKDGNTVRDEHGNPVMVQRFGMATVFDISQTDPVPGFDALGEAAAGLSTRLDGDDTEGIIRAVSAWLARCGWMVDVGGVHDGVHGRLDMEERVIVLRDVDSPAQRAAMLLHDAAHVAMLTLGDEHQATPGGICETEAESIAYVVANLLGMDTAAYSIGYVAAWSVMRPDALQQVAGHVLKASGLIFDAIEAGDGPREIEGAPLQLTA